MKSIPQKNKATALAAFAAATACAFLAPTASASLVAYDGFEYDISGGAGLNGKGSAGSGWVGSWTSVSQATIVEDNMVYSNGDITINGGSQALRINGPTSATYFSREFTQINNVSEVYFSFLYKPVAGANNDLLNFWLSEDNDRLNSGGIGDVSGSNTFGTRIFDDANQNNAKQGSMNYAFDGSVYLLVGRISTDGATAADADVFDRVQLWVNPTSVSLGDALVTQDLSLNLSTSMGFSFFGLQTYDIVNGDYHHIDEFRVGTSAAGVLAIPEPSTYAAIFGGLALVAGLVRRKLRAGKA